MSRIKQAAAWLDTHPTTWVLPIVFIGFGLLAGACLGIGLENP